MWVKHCFWSEIHCRCAIFMRIWIISKCIDKWMKNKERFGHLFRDDKTHVPHWFRASSFLISIWNSEKIEHKNIVSIMRRSMLNVDLTMAWYPNPSNTCIKCMQKMEWTARKINFLAKSFNFWGTFDDSCPRNIIPSDSIDIQGHVKSTDVHLHLAFFAE